MLRFPKAKFPKREKQLPLPRRKAKPKARLRRSATVRNGSVIGIVPVKDDDELMMMTARGKIQRVKVSDFNPIGRNTQGVRIMSLDEGDTLAAIVCVPT